MLAVEGDMALKNKNAGVERRAREVAALTGKSKTRAVRVALESDRRANLRRFLEQRVWPTVPKDLLGKEISREEEDAILGYR